MIFKNLTRDDLDLPTVGLTCEAHGTVEVTGDAAQGLLKNPAFERVDDPQPRLGARADGDSDQTDDEDDD